ncbi:hypothetical protein PP175_29560 (plasmid) [Aneurinibacillus sp. Ricciae_BoGa-3]|uniref:DUF5983 family protein n=1 Tax=Aneurinibacillus sp. Ricciae_BoGa-3 TaxID=3022697 RepID=UPI00234244FC|nr:hypothetical protein [Aneurinibacillus sp. Ricciae_BoGa-3]WCK57340.1 hypothetical protein PP175_29560 [Aneurinibacillus sp. Ricciae_BoGa-3]
MTTDISKEKVQVNLTNVIVKTLELSTAHVSEATTKWIDASIHDSSVLVVYDKSEFGWFIKVPNFSIEQTQELNLVPKDLLGILKMAYDNDCQWVMFDYIANEIEGLPVYKN